jgi:uncharacterized protein (DUF433 family)
LRAWYNVIEEPYDMQIVLDKHIESNPDVLGGKPCIAGHRIAVEHVVKWHLHLGQSIDDIARTYALSHSSIHAALAYYYDHKSEMDRKMSDDAAWVEGQRRQTPSKLRDKLNLEPGGSNGA